MAFNIEEYYKEITKGNVVIAYKGKITHIVINDLLDKVEQELTEKNESIKKKKKIYNISIEGLQNLYHHIENQSDDIINAHSDKFGVFVVEQIDENYRIILGNFVDEEQKNYLEEKITKINSLSLDELKDLYTHILDHQKMSSKGGGGLGLLDMAKKSSNKLDYNFFSYSNNWYFYNLKLIVS
jgi:Glu-tRNA(Gln) amidotransferase subunit E-like FAD-binding protein